MAEITAAETAVFSPAYCMTLDRLRLSVLSQEAVDLAAREMMSGCSLLVVSSAYDSWYREQGMKLERFARYGFKAVMKFIGPVKDTYEEVEKTLAAINEYNARVRVPIRRLIVACEIEHGPRAVKAFQRIASQRGLDLEIVGKYFRVSRLERTYEPHPIQFLGWVKSVRASNRLLWWFWNKAIGLVF